MIWSSQLKQPGVIHNGYNAIYVSRRGKRDLSLKHEMVVKRLYQIVQTTESLFLKVELAITLSKMGLETYFFNKNDQQNALNNILCQTQFSSFRLRSLLPRRNTDYVLSITMCVCSLYCFQVTDDTFIGYFMQQIGIQL